MTPPTRAALTLRERVLFAVLRVFMRMWPASVVRAIDRVAVDSVVRGRSPRVLDTLAEIRARLERGNVETALALLERGPRDPEAPRG